MPSGHAGAGSFLALLAAVACAGNVPVRSAPRPAETRAVGSGPAERPAVTFTKAVPAVGTIVEDESTMAIDLAMKVTAGSHLLAHVQGHHVKSERRRITVLATRDRAVTKIEVRYLEKSESGDEGVVKSPLSGKTYVLERRGTDLVVTDADGAPVSGIERALLSQEHRKLGKPSKFAAFVPDRPLSPGDRIEPPESVIEEMFGDGGDDVKVRSASFEFLGATGPDTGAFGLRMKITLVGEPDMDMDVGGRAVVRISDTYPTELSLEGPITIDGVSSRSGAHFEGDGAMKLHRLARFR